jgi:hypothetical protein
MIIQRRYDDISNPSEGIQSLETMTLLRWAFFIICSLPPVIKLLCMTNATWTRAYGAMFLASFIIIEGLALIKGRQNLTQDDHLSERRNSQLDLSSGPIELLNRIMRTSAFIIHISLQLWALLDIWLNPLGVIDPLLDFNFSIRLITEALMISLILYYAYIYTMGVLFVIIGIPMKLAWYLQDRHPWAGEVCWNYVVFMFEKYGWAWIGAPTLFMFFELHWKLMELDAMFLKWVAIDYGLVLDWYSSLQTWWYVHCGMRMDITQRARLIRVGQECLGKECAE